MHPFLIVGSQRYACEREASFCGARVVKCGRAPLIALAGRATRALIAWRADHSWFHAIYIHDYCTVYTGLPVMYIHTQVYNYSHNYTSKALQNRLYTRVYIPI